MFLATALRPSPGVLFTRSAGFNAGEHRNVCNAAWRSQSLTTALRPSAVTVRALRERRCGFDAGEHLSVVLGCLAQSASGNGANLWRRLFGRRRACSLRAALTSKLACITDVPRRGAAKPQGRKRKPVGGPGRRKGRF